MCGGGRRGGVCCSPSAMTPLPRGHYPAPLRPSCVMARRCGCCRGALLLGARLLSAGCLPLLQGTSCFSTNAMPSFCQCSLSRATSHHLVFPAVAVMCLSVSKLGLYLPACRAPMLLGLSCSSAQNCMPLQAKMSLVAVSAALPTCPQRFQIASSTLVLHLGISSLWRVTLAARNVLVFHSCQLSPGLLRRSIMILMCWSWVVFAVRSKESWIGHVGAPQSAASLTMTLYALILLASFVLAHSVFLFP